MVYLLKYKIQKGGIWTLLLNWQVKYLFYNQMKWNMQKEVNVYSYLGFKVAPGRITKGNNFIPSQVLKQNWQCRVYCLFNSKKGLAEF